MNLDGSGGFPLKPKKYTPRVSTVEECMNNPLYRKVAEYAKLNKQGIWKWLNE